MRAHLAPRRRRLPAGCLLLLLCGIAALGQDEPFRFRVDVELVTLDVGVSDAGGRPVSDLKRDDFQIYEDGQLREIRSFSSVETPYNVLSLLDCTSSVQESWPVLIKAYSSFVNTLRPQDRVSMAYFGSTTHSLLDWTPRNAGMTVTLRLDPSICHTTDVYSALDWSLTRFKNVTGRKGVVVFTDGIQTVGVRRKNSDIGGIAIQRIVDSREDAAFQNILRRISRSEVVFYFIAVNTDLNPTPVDTRLGPSTEYTALAIYNLQQVRSRMQQIAEASGGRVAFPKKSSDVEPIYRQIASTLGMSYSLSYTPQRAGSGRYHRIEVRVRGPGLSVRQSREGYMEP
jgi:VWFA-related protein